MWYFMTKLAHVAAIAVMGATIWLFFDRVRDVMGMVAAAIP